MPIVKIPEISAENLLNDASRRWEAVARARPDLLPAVDLQRQLLAIVLELAREFRHGKLPRLSLPPKYLAAKLARGVPALAGEPIPVPAAALLPALLTLCDTLASGGAADAAEHIASAIRAHEIDAGSFLTASLARDQEAVRSGALHRGLAPDLMWLIGELAIGPFAHALQTTLFTTNDQALAGALEAWNHGYCPACGSWPALAEAVHGHRTLRCSFCAAGWELTTYACIYCGNDADTFVTAAPDIERKDRRVEACSACAAYLKTIDVDSLSPFPLVAISDLETTDLDVAAMEHGYARPPMKMGLVRAKG